MSDMARNRDRAGDRAPGRPGGRSDRTPASPEPAYGGPEPQAPTGTNPPLEPPETEGPQRAKELEGDRRRADPAAIIGRTDPDPLPELNDTEVYEGDLEALGATVDAGDRADSLESLTTLELRTGETDDANVAAEEGLTYVAPMDPPVIPSDVGDDDAIEVAAGFGSTAIDEPFDQDHHSEELSAEDEVSDRVREALRANASTSAFADDLAIGSVGGRVALRGVVDDLEDSDNAAAVAQEVQGVDEVIDELRVRALEE